MQFRTDTLPHQVQRLVEVECTVCGHSGIDHLLDQSSEVPSVCCEARCGCERFQEPSGRLGGSD